MKTALYYIRTRCNYSQGMVARELDVSRQMLSAWENGTKTIPKARKEELAMLFGVPVEILEEQDGSLLSEATVTGPCFAAFARDARCSLSVRKAIIPGCGLRHLGRIVPKPGAEN